MGIIKNYTSFLNENINIIPNDMINILELIKGAKTSDILKFRNDLKELSKVSENLNESIISDFIDNIKIKFQKKLDDKIWKYLINRKRDFYVDLAEKLNIFDLTSLDDVFKNYPGFTIDSVYLAGGMDKAKDVGAGWRLVVENQFEKYPGKSTVLPKISLGEFGEVEPKRVVNGIYLEQFINDPKKTEKLYNLPLILNPVRKEVDRTKNVAFSQALSKYKSISQETEPHEYEPTLTDLRKTMSKTIEPDDEHLVRISDLIFLGLNVAAAAGTYGELQTQSFMNKPIFVYMTSPEWTLGPTEQEPYGGFSPWTFPHITKLARNTDEMKTLVSTIMSYVK